MQVPTPVLIHLPPLFVNVVCSESDAINSGARAVSTRPQDLSTREIVVTALWRVKS